MSNLMHGLQAVMAPHALAWILLGVVVGIVFGMLPGLGSIAGMALLFPLAFTLDPVTAIAMLAAVYFGVMYGGTVGGILLNMPGTDQAIPSTYEGYPMSQQGRAGPALVIQAVVSFVGGTLGVVLLMVLAPFVTRMATSFGPPEFAMLILLALLMIVAVLGADAVKGAVSALAGFALATVGIDVISGSSRFTFDNPDLLSGIGYIPVTIGLFALGEVLYGVYEARQAVSKGSLTSRKGLPFWPSRREWRESTMATIRGSALGFLVGVIPGAGASIAAQGSYAVEKAVARDRSRFGKGSIPGLAGPSAADNAASSGSMVPLLSLGIPGSAATAVLMGALIIMGLQPGPQMMSEHADVAWGIVASMYVSNIVLLALCLFGIPVFMRIVLVPYYILAPCVIVVATIGTFLAEGSMFDVWVMYVAGIAGFFMKRFGYSPAALIVAMVLGPLMETSVRQSLLVSNGSLLIFVQRPIGAVVFAVICCVVALMASRSIMAKIRMRRAPGDSADPGDAATATSVHPSDPPPPSVAMTSATKVGAGNVTRQLSPDELRQKGSHRESN